MNDDYMFYVDLDIFADDFDCPVNVARAELGGDYTELVAETGPSGCAIVRIWTYGQSTMRAVLEEYHQDEDEADWWMENYVMKGELNVSNINSLD